MCKTSKSAVLKPGKACVLSPDMQPVQKHDNITSQIPCVKTFELTKLQKVHILSKVTNSGISCFEKMEKSLKTKSIVFFCHVIGDPLVAPGSSAAA